MSRSADSITKIQHLIQTLSLEHKQALVLWLSELIEQEQQHPEEVPVHPNREVVEQHQQGRVTYQLEHVKCGKEACRCNLGQLHGPY